MSEIPRLTPVRSADELEQLVQRVGFLPFFRHEIAGLSVEECCPPELWFQPDVDGPWEWKGPVAHGRKCVYGKFFRGRAGFVSLEWFADFANYRRDGYDFDARFDDGLASVRDRAVYETIVSQGSILTPDLKARCRYRRHENKGFDGIITRLQMQTYVNVIDFAYGVTAGGKPYGWGVARYSTPELCFGAQRVVSAYEDPAAASLERMLAHLRRLCPHASEQALYRLLRGV